MFVLEMGEPVMIVDLAKAMISLSGLEPERDIAIEIVGARPGEKLHEELFNPYERPQPTPAQKIVRAEREPLDPAWVETTFGEINLLVLEGDAAALAEEVSRLSKVRAGAAPGARRPARHVDCERSMGSPAYAFSVHNFINSVGADAGFASIIGLAILVLLYFAQARETATLRENAKEAAARIMELERRLAQLAQWPGAGRLAPAPGAAARPAANDRRRRLRLGRGGADLGRGRGRRRRRPDRGLASPPGRDGPQRTGRRGRSRADRRHAPDLDAVPHRCRAPSEPAPARRCRSALGPVLPPRSPRAPSAAPAYTNGTGRASRRPAATRGRSPGRPPAQGRPGGPGARPGATAAARAGTRPPRGSPPSGRRRAVSHAGCWPPSWCSE